MDILLARQQKELIEYQWRVESVKAAVADLIVEFSRDELPTQEAVQFLPGWVCVMNGGTRLVLFSGVRW
ncbi:tagatose-1,6-bisphosphate aldolase non-catalytic subunit AgaZ/GatZ [Streptomyces zagrosensis]|uniref:Tagatose-1,6-bisphosphate aldolase non-catalytic subunit AgaZ/GatZ n=1 Tax=Streptomyces zagrosensis TaxID=1042984 RepID=A0A7W9V2S5_9ACTN|nr:tagatose-1,6-bisphosphate aldolase non-catalytic subunit AgaZ/GatZ [Streptomyces zagrosensis]